MTRAEVLKKLRFSVPEGAHIRMIVDTDAKNEADDQFAIIHHLLTPIADVVGIVATHFEKKTGFSGDSMEQSYQEVCKVLELAEIEDVPTFRGCVGPLADEQDTPDAPGVDFIIREALREDSRPLYIAVQGAMTNVAAALNKRPEIGSRMTVIWNGGGPYPAGRPEFNVMQDPAAVRVLLGSAAQVWQTPVDVYRTLEISFAELSHWIAPCGALGDYLLRQMEDECVREYAPGEMMVRSGENWTLGDNTTVAVLLMNRRRDNWHVAPAPILNADLTYSPNPEGKLIRIYDWIDSRLTIQDLFCKMQLAYRT